MQLSILTFIHLFVYLFTLCAVHSVHSALIFQHYLAIFFRFTSSPILGRLLVSSSRRTLVHFIFIFSGILGIVEHFYFYLLMGILFTNNHTDSRQPQSVFVTVNF